jgi:hypothetical protein
LRELSRTLRLHDQSLFCLTRRAMSAGGFLTTIHSITEVAAARAYLGGGVRLLDVKMSRGWVCGLPCEDILCMIVSEVDLSGSSNWDASSLPIPSFQQIRICNE